MIKNIISLLSFLLFPLFSIGQSDTVIAIPEVEISAEKIRKQPIGTQLEKWDSEKLNSLPAQNIAELLTTESGTFIKSYGSGSLATSSIRGGSAGHTLVLWNGFSLQSPILGLLDLSLLPLSGSEEISLQKGGSSALWGSGAIGGVIALNNKSDFNTKKFTNVKTTIGSFGNFNQEVKFGFGNKRVQSVTKIFHQQGENDFKYFVAPNFPRREQTNAQVSQQNILQDFYWKIDKKNQLAFHFWQQFSDRNIPPTNVQTKSEAHQNDQATRILLDWKNVNKTYVLQGKVGFFKEHLDYFDDATDLASLSDFTTLTGEFTGQKFWKNTHKLFAGITHSFTTANNDGYVNPPTENRSAVQFSYFFQQKKYKLQASVRQGLIDGKLIPIVPSLGFDYTISPSLKLQGKVSRNYRIPTLNDRFWQVGGNENLNPESGWSQEASIFSKINLNNSSFKFSITGFNRNINQWILWAPVEGQSIWSAFNISRVWSRGIEPRFSFSQKIKTIQFHLFTGYDFIKSTNQVAMDLPKREVGQQLIYVPTHQAFGQANLVWKNIELSYQQSFVGKSRGQYGDIESYQTGNARIQYSHNWKKCKSIVFFNINNIWDTNYIVVERRPMPGTNYQIGINFLFQKQLNHVRL
jgi:iron complex outermembrane receptor protein